MGLVIILFMLLCRLLTVSSTYLIHVVVGDFADLMAGKKVIDAGWGQRHPLDGSKAFKKMTGMWLPNQYIYIYAPRDDDEIETVMGIVKASVAYMTRSEQVRG
jgi:hypothetical protein